MLQKLISLFTGLKFKLILYGGLALTVLLFLLTIYSKGRRDGNSSLRQQLNDHKDKVEAKWSKIDSAPASVDSALSGLRKRSAQAGYRTPAKPTSSKGH